MFLKRSTSMKKTANDPSAPARLGCARPAAPAVQEHHAVGEPRQRIDAPRRHLRPDARQRDVEVDRLGHVVVGAELERLDHVLVAVLGGDHDDRQVDERAGLAHLAQRLDAAHPRHHHVEQHGVDAVRVDQLERARPALGGEDRVALARQAARERVAVHLLVVDEEQRGVHRVHEGPFAAWRSRSAAIRRSRASKSIGFVSKSSQPAAVAFSRSPTIAGRQRDDRDRARRGVGLEPARALPPVDLGQPAIEEDQVGTFFPCDLEAAQAVGGEEHVEAAAAEPARENVAIHLVVVDDENPIHVRAPLLPIVRSVVVTSANTRRH
jgi:hypothetical protein